MIRTGARSRRRGRTSRQSAGRRCAPRRYRRAPALHEGRLPSKPRLPIAAGGRSRRGGAGGLNRSGTSARCALFRRRWCSVSPARRRAGELGRELSDYVFYVWLPDYENIFAALSRIHSRPHETQEVPETRGTKRYIRLPGSGQMISFGGWRKMAPWPGIKTVRDLALQFELWCEDRGREVPKSTQLRAYVTGVLKALRAPPHEPSK